MSADDPVDVKEEPDEEYIGDGDVELLPYEQRTLLETMADDVLFITARGLGLERLFLNHLIMYSDQKLLFLVINTNEHDEAYFLSKLKENDIPCQPKLINYDVSVKDREAIYLEGGVQFITSRILLMDLLTSRIAVEHVAGILVWRAHQVLNTFQDSFILRLYREKKKGGFIKAFTDFPTQCSAFGQLQRLIDRLYVKKTVILPRFHQLIRESLDRQAITEWSVHLPQTIRRIHSTIYDIIRVCLRELKQQFLLPADDGISDGIFAFMTTTLEKQLMEKKSYLTDKQRRLLSDLEILRDLLRVAQDLDPASLLHKLNTFRNDKEMLEKSSGWIVTPTAARLVADIEAVCKAKTFQAPPKWRILSDVLEEIKEMKVSENELGPNGPSVLVFVSNDQTCRQVSDLIRNGPKFVEWLSKRYISEVGHEPVRSSLWLPDNVSMYMRANFSAETRGELKTGLQKDQKEVARAARKRRKFAEDLMMQSSSLKQTRISQFGILKYKKREAEAAPVEPKEEPIDEDDDIQEIQPKDGPKSLKDFPNVQLVVQPVGEKYNTLRYLDDKKPNVIVFYNSDVSTIRTVEVYSACNPNINLVVHQLMYVESTEEQRYLTMINNETKAFEAIVQEKRNLLIPRTWDVAREEPLMMPLSSRDGGGQLPEEVRPPMVVVDVREFNSELPTVLYKKGVDVEPVTLEVGDYVLAPEIAVERKALDDLYQSLQSGRVLKQSEQMLRHYSNSVLLIESSKKFDSKKVNGGPFQGELSRHCRDIRALFCQLIRSYPRLKIIWSQSPETSAEVFLDLKLGKRNPDVEKAVAKRADEVLQSKDEASNKSLKANPVILRHLAQNLPGMARGDVERMMVSGKVKNLKELLSSSAAVLYGALSHHSDQVALLTAFDFRQQDA